MSALDSDSQNVTGKPGYADILREIRDRYRYARAAWDPILKEAQEDMRYVCGDPWSAKDKAERDDAGRPYLVMDELGQYLNQTKNQLRQNPRGIKIDPVGEGANDKTADFNQSLIRGIEYDSNATRNAYQPAFENALERGYGFFRVTRKYIHGKKHQVIHIKGILNPDSVVFDPDYTEADWSDARYCFVVEPMPKEVFKSRFPKATIQDFSAEDMLTAPDWVQDQIVLVAEYWRVTEDEDGKRSVVQYMTNGVEILEPPTEEFGSYLPIIPVIGREKYLTSGGRTERKIFSMVRLARDPYMYFCYLASQEAEEASLTPKVPIFAYVGQCETDAVAIESMTKVPHAVIQFDPIVDQATNQILPIPTRPQFQPNFQAYEVAKDSASRSIMKAMGLSPLPTAAQRSNEKSGIALETIETQQNIGAFDFTDNFDRSLQLTGRILLEWIPMVYTQERHVGLVAADGKRKVVRINTSQPYDSGDGVM
ncbi:MAG: portal protein, partial [Candidatus Acidiferrum sp.]